ncbi:MAG: phosphoenolpyruvate carboxykinase (ATP) [Saprospiraceae bacterium]|uniref:Phosphoenolpyruvate carboxykinase (ATP) n=1 Tax=Candidatus Opimibacter skivensis TaxID=2982028 RepID=A0A9D7XNT6_9BACT|nr:phosphoenolpyruvate carboxykinase (ATP) [Candidatus Opimibacter skivensis]
MNSQLTIFLQHLSLDPEKIHYMLTPAELIEATIQKGQGVLNDTGALCIDTGKFTGRSPKDRYIVKDDITRETVDWGLVNKPFGEDQYEVLKKDILDYVRQHEIFIHDGYVCSDDIYRLNVRVLAEYPWSALFANNMFLRLTGPEIDSYAPEWTVVCAPGFKADPSKHGTRQANFAVINFTDRAILIGGTGYTGEIKKGIFSVLNYILPQNENTLSMHCSSNVGKQGDTAVFFGLSGTGKTTLSADPQRYLIGDDEHGWSEEGVFNFEGGCYAKCVDLTEEKEPDIFRAIKHGALLENIRFYPGSRTVNYADISVTENTRVSYPLYHIQNVMPGSVSGHPRNIFFLTADAFGTLPPISKLTPAQAMYHFISGYTAKVAGTEAGVTEPQATFSACFGAPFLPLHPTQYASMLGELMRRYKVNVWLVNTGWSGGPYGVGSRIKLSNTRAMITAALEGNLNHVRYKTHEVFNLAMPMSCPGISDQNILNPVQTWKDAEAYKTKAISLAQSFHRNFYKYASQASDEILSGGPQKFGEIDMSNAASEDIPG